ncbi:hypothetical protein [Oceanithermus sp.]
MFRDEDLRYRALLPLAESQEEGEPACLQELAAAGERLLPTWVVPAWVEEEFYRLNNLTRQIERLFAGVWGVRVDEERLARAAEQARALIHQSYLLAERGEGFVSGLPPRSYCLRRPGSLELFCGGSPQEALWALKHVWAARWRLAEVMERGPELPPPQVVLVQAAVGEEPVWDESSGLYRVGDRVFACALR